MKTAKTYKLSLTKFMSTMELVPAQIWKPEVFQHLPHDIKMEGVAMTVVLDKPMGSINKCLLTALAHLGNDAEVEKEITKCFTLPLIENGKEKIALVTDGRIHIYKSAITHIQVQDLDWADMMALTVACTRTHDWRFEEKNGLMARIRAAMAK